MSAPKDRGVYFVSDDYIRLFGLYDSAVNSSWLSPKRPLVCLYLKKDGKSHPYFVPLFSINPRKNSFDKRSEKWGYYLSLDSKQNLRTALSFDNLLSHNDKNYSSIVQLSKILCIPWQHLSPKKFKGNNVFQIPWIASEIIKAHAQKYIESSINKNTNEVEEKGYLKVLTKLGKKHDPPTNHPLLLKATLEYQRRKEEAKQKNQNTLMEEKEK